MVFDWVDFCEVGIHLLNHSDKESYQRSAVGRLYYACFGKSKQYYEKAFLRTLPSNNSHAILINEFNESNFKKERLLAKHLHQLRKIRNQADYQVVELKENDVNSSKNNAKKVFEILDDLKRNPVRLITF